MKSKHYGGVGVQRLQKYNTELTVLVTLTNIWFALLAKAPPLL